MDEKGLGDEAGGEGGGGGGAGGGGSSALPQEIVEAIAISNAKSIGEQPAILANMALANQILNNNMQQQMILGQQQAFNQLIMATMSKCVSLITSDGPGMDGKDMKELIKMMQVMQHQVGGGAGGSGADG